MAPIFEKNELLMLEDLIFVAKRRQRCSGAGSIKKTGY